MSEETIGRPRTMFYCPETAATIKLLRDGGWTNKRVAKHLEIPYSRVVSTYRTKRGISPLTRMLAKQAKKLRKKGLLLKEIAAQMGLSIPRVHSLIHKNVQPKTTA